MLQSMVSQRVGHNWATEQQWHIYAYLSIYIYIYIYTHTYLSIYVCIIKFEEIIKMSQIKV